MKEGGGGKVELAGLRYFIETLDVDLVVLKLICNLLGKFKQNEYIHSIFLYLALIWLCSPFCSDYLFKLLLIGDSGVGKSCLLLRFAVSSTIKWFLWFSVF